MSQWLSVWIVILSLLVTIVTRHALARLISSSHFGIELHNLRRSISRDCAVESRSKNRNASCKIKTSWKRMDIFKFMVHWGGTDVVSLFFVVSRRNLRFPKTLSTEAKMGLAGSLNTMLMSALFRRFMSFKPHIRQQVCLAWTVDDGFLVSLPVVGFKHVQTISSYLGEMIQFRFHLSFSDWLKPPTRFALFLTERCFFPRFVALILIFWILKIHVFFSKNCFNLT